MKFKYVIITIVALSGIAVAFLVFGILLQNKPLDRHSLEEVSEWSEAKQQGYMKEILMYDGISDDDKVKWVIWGVREHRDEVESLFRERGGQIGGLPDLIGNSAISMLRANDRDLAISILKLGGELYPNNPSILGAMGISAYLENRLEEARILLEQAESWRQPDPLVNLYFGGLLLESEQTAELARGKAILMRVVDGNDPELSEFASLALVTSPTAPLLEADYQRIFSTLTDLGALRADNQNLTAEIVRILANRALRFSTESALKIALLLFEFEEVTVQDQLNIVILAQTLNQLETAREILEGIDNESLSPGSSEDSLFREHTAIQSMLIGNFDEGLEAFHSLVQTSPSSGTLHEAFQLVFREAALPLEIERSMLELFLDLPVENGPLSLAALNRLTEINPLHFEKWSTYAIMHLFPVYPGLTAQWLIQKGKPLSVAEALSNSTPPLDKAKAIALVEAYLAAADPLNAKDALKSSEPSIPQALVEFYYARIALGVGDNEEALEKWTAAHNAARLGNNYSLMKNLGFLAIELNQSVNALQTMYTAFSAGIEFSQNQLGRLLNLTLENGSLNQTINVAESLRTLFPGEPVHINNLAYFRFLANESIEESVDNMRELVEEHPDVKQYRLTLALGLLKLGRNNEAKRMLESTSIDWDEAGTRGKMIYAAVLAANNQEVVARGLIQNIDISTLIPEESALLE